MRQIRRRKITADMRTKAPTHATRQRPDASKALHWWRIDARLKNMLAWLPVLLASIVCTCAQAGAVPARYMFDRAPAWVDAIDATAIPPSDIATGRAVRRVLKDVQVNVASGTSTTVYTHMAAVPVDASGIADAAHISIQFNPHYQSLTLHDIAIVRDGVRMRKVDRRRIKVLQNEPDRTRRMYDGTVSLFVQLDDVRVNDLVEYAYSVKGTNPVLGTPYSAWFALAFDHPVERIEIRLRAPASRPFHYKLFQTSLEPVRSQHGDIRELRWTVQHAAPATIEDGLPADYNPYPRVQVSDYDTWRDVLAWAAPLYRVRGALSPAIDKRVMHWQRNTRGKEALAATALDFVQQEIRYLGIETGARSHRPTHPNQVFRQRFGDCKDKSQLLTAMLRRAGIRAYPALVSRASGKAVADGLPSPQAFDHVITFAEIDGKRYWLDATLGHQRGPLRLRGAAPYGKALVIGDAHETLVDVAVASEGGTNVRIDERFDVASLDQPVAAVVTSRYAGNAAEHMRALFAGTSTAQVERNFLNDYAARYPSARFVSLSFEDRPDINEVTVTERYALPDFFRQHDGHVKSPLYLYGWGLAAYVRLPQVRKRSMPLALSYPLSVTHDIDMQFAHNALLPGHDESRQINNDSAMFGFARTTRADRIGLHYTFASLTDSVPADAAERYLSDLGAMIDYATRAIDIRTLPAEPAPIN